MQSTMHFASSCGIHHQDNTKIAASFCHQTGCASIQRLQTQYHWLYSYHSFKYLCDPTCQADEYAWGSMPVSNTLQDRWYLHLLCIRIPTKMKCSCGPISGGFCPCTPRSAYHYMFFIHILQNHSKQQSANNWITWWLLDRCSLVMTQARRCSGARSFRNTGGGGALVAQV